MIGEDADDICAIAFICEKPEPVGLDSRRASENVVDKKRRMFADRKADYDAQMYHLNSALTANLVMTAALIRTSDEVRTNCSNEFISLIELRRHFNFSTDNTI